MHPSYSHILICRTDNIGDVVLTLPLAGYLKSLYPGIRIDFLCSAYAASVVSNCRFVDQVIVLETLEDPAAYFARESFDTIIFAFPHRRLALAARKAGVKNRVGNSHRLFHWFTCNKLAHFSRARSALHEAQLNFALLRPMGIHYTPPLAAIPALFGLSAPRQVAIDALFSAAPFNLILHPKSNGSGREWPLGHYTQVAQRLLPYPNICVWITGSAAEAIAIAQEAAPLLALPNVQSVCGKFDLESLTALIGACDGLVASGTGPLHMSAALGRPTLGLFPPAKSINPARWGTLGEQGQTLCLVKCGGGCHDGATCACMRGITPEQVVAVILEWNRKKMDTAPEHALVDVQVAG